MLKRYIPSKYHERYKNVLRKKDTCVIALVIFYETKTKYPTKLYRLLICFLYSVIDHYICIDYLCCHSKTLSIIYSDKNIQRRKS